MAGGVVIAVLHGYPGQPGRWGVVGLGSEDKYFETAKRRLEESREQLNIALN